MDKINLAVVVTDDRKEVLGITANAPMEVVCMALMAQQDPQAPRVHIFLMTQEELDAQNAGRKPKPVAPMASLRGRGECPELVKGGELGAMLSILSDAVSKGDK